MLAEARPRGDVIERLLDAAEAEFAARGYDGARLEDIAGAVGIRRASLLYHFESKQALYDRVLERAFGELHAMIVAALGRPASTHAERLDEVVRRVVDDLARRPLFARLILRDTLDHEAVSAERGRRFVAPLLAIGDAFVRSGQQAGEFRSDLDPRGLLMLFVGSIVFHAAACAPVRDVLWGSRDLRKYRETVRAMMRTLALPDRPFKKRNARRRS